jgi:hypothetical protein
MTIMTEDVDLSAAGTILTVAGRTFRPCASTTFEQDIWIMSMLRDAGIMKAGESFQPGKEDLSEIATAVVMQAFTSGKLFEILAGTLEEIGVVWSIPTARANAQFFAQLTAPEDKAALNGSIVGALMGFFISGALSSVTSQKSSRPTMTHNDVGVRSDVAQSSEAPRTTASGTTSSETSQGTT